MFQPGRVIERLASRLHAPPEIVERREERAFIPCHPAPPVKSPNLVELVIGARRNLIEGWTERYYRAGIGSFRILRRQIVFVNSPEHIRYVVVTRHGNFERKSPQMRRALEALLGDGLFISDGDTWSRRRPLVADIVHKRRLPEFGRTMEDAALAVAAEWAALPQEAEIELTEEMGRLTAAIISRAVFGKNIARAAAQQVIEGFSAYQRQADSFNLGYFLGADEGWPTLGGPQRRRAIAKVHGVVEAVINAHLAGEGDAGSMVDLLIRRNRRSEGQPLDTTALRNEAATIFMAGHETTATTLTWAWYLLANAPWVAKAVHDEIDAACGPRSPTLADLPQLRWCRAVIQETLRLYPPVPLLPRQALEADRIGDLAVEKSALVMIAPWLLHRSADLWEKPNHFLPERFLSGARIDPYAYIPFAVGPRICPGMNFGLDEATLCLAILAQRFEVQPRAGYRVEPVCRLTLRPKGGLPATIVRRPAPNAG
ncbi:cytochrome P450 [Ancylobacter sp. 6x-1]|uniref:Cytochrome P450 n=1 Tax=Ancylobacter crimeensis TaxID=2579147 RepID=A0ABT0DAP2_9HYPH|nr:cytochrome P450 [Ancylobacter crimeensis]MCK0197007.1 cytochrome P450 [Ancylobacter crimeensis]